MDFFFGLNKVKVDKETAKPLENIEIVDIKIVKEEEMEENVKMEAKLEEMATHVSLTNIFKCA